MGHRDQTPVSQTKIILKDGRQCTLCCTIPNYAAEMIDYLKVTAAETPFQKGKIVGHRDQTPLSHRR